MGFFLPTSKLSQIQAGQWNDDNVTFQISPPVKLDPNYNWECGLWSLSAWNTQNNISPQLNNNQLRYYNGTTWKPITLITGSYDIIELNDTIQNIMFLNGDYNSAESTTDKPVYYITFVPNNATGLLTIEIAPASGYQFDISIGNFSRMLGFTPQILTTSATGTMIVDVTNGVDSWHVHCSIAGGSFDGGVESDILYGFVPASPKGYEVIEAPNNVMFFPVNTNVINSIRMQLTDQNNNPVDLNGNHITYRIVIRPAIAVQQK